MAETRLYSVAALAKMLDIPESTLHYWKNRFDDVLPSVGTGRGKRFRAEAVDIFRSIGRLLGQGLTAADVRAELTRNHPINVSPMPAPAPTDPSPPVDGPPAGDAALVMAARIGAEIARSLAVELHRGFPPPQTALPEPTVAALQAELATVAAQNTDLTEKMRLLEAELVRLRKDRRDLESYLVDKINALRRNEPPA